ncbi:MAG: hypothetical protein HY906_23425, partial [Deltaproteobacteria bacterium]|nr:hypothetical protein [Deltaproteobacteria bacterium]
GFNDGEADLRAIARWLRQRAPAPGGAAVLLQPFHRLAVAKTGRLGRPYPFASRQPTSPAHFAAAAATLRREGVAVLEG